MSFRRLHIELLMQFAKDLQLENIVTDFDIDTDIDLWEQSKLTDVELPASQPAIEITKPTGSAKIRAIFVYDVLASSGINLRLNGASNDPILVVPSGESGAVGIFALTTNATTLHVDNPSSSAEVAASIFIVCGDS